MLTPKKIAFLALAALIAACTAETPNTDTGFRTETNVATAEIKSIDPDTREIGLTTEEGEDIVIPASPEVRNFDQLEVGDTVRVTFTEAVAVKLAAEADRGEQSKTVAAGRAVSGEKPGLTIGSVSEEVVEFVSFDEGTGDALFIDANGKARMVAVPPEMRDFAKSREKGDLIAASIERAFAIAIVPQE